MRGPVAPRAGAWIETQLGAALATSPPVATRAGAWLETPTWSAAAPPPCVAPRAGAWIETLPPPRRSARVASPPARGRGLKLHRIAGLAGLAGVAPRAGAWIETWRGSRHSQRG